MTPQIFYIGQEVVCTEKDIPPRNPGASEVPTPVYNQIYHISEYVWFKYGEWWVTVEEISKAFLYTEDCFAPVGYREELVECLEEELAQ